MTDSTALAPTIEAATAESKGLRARGRLVRLVVQATGLTTFYTLTILFFSWRSSQFLTASNAINILSNVSVIGIVSIGQTFAIISGGFDLSVSGTIPLGAVTYATLINAGVNIPLAMALTISIGLLVGAANGILVNKVGINPLIATLGTLQITSGLAKTIAGGLTQTFAYREAGFLAVSSIGRIPNHIWMLLLISMVAFFILRFTVFGRSVYAIGGNHEASRLAGLRVDLVSVIVYMICAGLATFAGIIVASQLLAGSATFGRDAVFTSIAAAILGGAALTGGKGSVPGTLVGVLLLGTFSNGLALLAVSPFYQQIATGSVLLLAVGFGRLQALFGLEE